MDGRYCATEYYCFKMLLNRGNKKMIYSFSIETAYALKCKSTIVILL